MPSAPEALRKIRDKLDAGTLPTERPVAMYAGHGSSDSCAGCDETIQAAQIEYERHHSGGRIFRLHIECALLLEAECLARGHREP